MKCNFFAAMVLSFNDAIIFLCCLPLKTTWIVSIMKYFLYATYFPACQYGICGDVNLQDIDCEANDRASHTLDQLIVATAGLEYIVNFPTMNDNTLNFVLNICKLWLNHVLECLV